MALTHGAYSDASIAPLGRDLVNVAVAASAYLAEPQYTATLEAWARSEAQVRLLDTWLVDNGTLDDEGKPRPAVELLARYEKLAAQHRDALGLSPLARSRLGHNVAGTQLDLAQLMSAVSDDDPQDAA